MRPGLTACLRDFLKFSMAFHQPSVIRVYLCFFPLQHRERNEQLRSLNNLPRSIHFLPCPYNLWLGEINSTARGKKPNTVMVKKLSSWEQIVDERNELSVRASPVSKWKRNDWIRALRLGNTRVERVKALSVSSCGCCKKRTHTACPCDETQPDLDLCSAISAQEIGRTVECVQLHQDCASSEVRPPLQVQSLGSSRVKL